MLDVVVDGDLSYLYGPNSQFDKSLFVAHAKVAFSLRNKILELGSHFIWHIQQFDSPSATT